MVSFPVSFSVIPVLLRLAGHLHLHLRRDTLAQQTVHRLGEDRSELIYGPDTLTVLPEASYLISVSLSFTSFTRDRLPTLKMCCENDVVRAKTTVSDITYLAPAQQRLTGIQLGLSAQRVKVQRTHVKKKYVQRE